MESAPSLGLFARKFGLAIGQSETFLFGHVLQSDVRGGQGRIISIWRGIVKDLDLVAWACNDPATLMPDHDANRKREKRGFEFLNKAIPGFYVPTSGEKDQLLEMLGISRGTYIGDYDLFTGDRAAADSTHDRKTAVK